MLRPAAALLLLLTMALAGCVSQSALPVPTLGLAEPWRENWTPRGTDFAFDLDPAARSLAAEGTLRVRNELGHAQGWLLFAPEPFTLTSVRDEAGAELDFTVEEPSEALPGPRGLPWPPVPEDVANTLFSFQLVNVTLNGDVAPGAVRTLSNAGAVPGAVQLRAASLSGRTLDAWGFVPGGETADVALPLPAGFDEPIVRVEADPFQYVYEWDDTDNVWTGAA